jgi:hypothetical protein
MGIAVDVINLLTSGRNDSVHTPECPEDTRESIRDGFFRRHITLQADDLQPVKFQIFAGSGDLRFHPHKREERKCEYVPAKSISSSAAFCASDCFRSSRAMEAHPL